MSPDRRSDPAFAALLVDSHRRLVGRALAAASLEAAPTAAWLYAEAPFCLLAHEAGDDPRFIYANTTAQRCFGYAWSEFLELPSRLSAEAPDRAERQRALDAVARDGFVANYRGVRIGKSGRRFFIANATVWTLIGPDDVRHGQAAVFDPPSDIL